MSLSSTTLVLDPSGIYESIECHISEDRYHNTAANIAHHYSQETGQLLELTRKKRLISCRIQGGVPLNEVASMFSQGSTFLTATISGGCVCFTSRG